MMKSHPALRYGVLGASLAIFACAPPMHAPQLPAAIPGGCAEPPKRPSEVGCYLIANQPIDRLPAEPVFWHIYSYRTRAAAEVEKSISMSTVAESFDEVWLLTIANAQWQPSTGERVAVIGPLPTAMAELVGAASNSKSQSDG
jgi:hypothetical protein